MIRSSILAAFLICSLSLPATAQPAESSKKKKPVPAAAERTEADEAAPAPTNGVDKASLESYLRDRSERIKELHKSRMDFIAQEAEAWNAFWVKVKDDRLLFEVRITRQRLDLFESLNSLESRNHSPSIVNFEKLQGDIIKTFELEQKQRMVDFFTDHDARWKSFAAQQEKDRLESVADAEMAWQGQKAGLRGQPSPEPRTGRKSQTKAEKGSDIRFERP